MSEIQELLEANKNLELLRFSTAGSVDDGKSTLIGRLLYDSKSIYEDQLASVEKDSKKLNRNVDLALLTDGLKAEREQGITIDVAYRYFSTPKRRFIISDTPGHEQYTRNMATGASTADVAIILIDARHGVLIQSKRHAFISSLLGIKRVILAVNKMDLVDYSQERFDEIIADFKTFCAKLNFVELVAIPISALVGDNVVNRLENTPWYKGQTIIEYLESAYIASDTNLQDFRFPVQLVSRPNSDFRGFMGTIASGIIRKGDEIIVLPSMKKSKVKSIVTFDGELDEAYTPMSITLTLEDEIDVSRGCVIAKPNNMPMMENYIDADIVWMSEKPAKVGNEVFFKHACATTKAVIDKIQYVFNPIDLSRTTQSELNLNQIARVRLRTYKEVICDEYLNNKVMGNFILIDPINNSTMCAGMIINKIKSVDPSLKNSEIKSTNITKVEQTVTLADREKRYGHKGATLWFTGLSGSGKSTIALELEKRLFERGCFAFVYDGDNIRFGLNRDLGFSEADRQENIRRIAEVAKLFNLSGGIAITSFISPFHSNRELAKEIIGDNYIEIYLDVTVEECAKRDPKGLYKKAYAGEISNFTGISSPFEIPKNPSLTIDSSKCNVEQAVDKIIDYLLERGIIC